MARPRGWHSRSSRSRPVRGQVHAAALKCLAIRWAFAGGALDEVSDAIVDLVRANLEERIGSANGSFSEGSDREPRTLTERDMRRT